MLGFTWKNRQGKFNWEVAKPSNVPIEQRPVWMTYDDAWVEEVKRGLSACKVFLFLPLFFVSTSSRIEAHHLRRDDISGLIESANNLHS